MENSACVEYMKQSRTPHGVNPEIAIKNNMVLTQAILWHEKQFIFIPPKTKQKNQKEAKPYCLHGLEWCCVDIDATTVRSFGNRLEHRRLWGCRENCRGWRLLRQRHGGLLSREGTIHITLKTVSKISHDCNEHFPTFQWKNYSIYKEFKN